MASRRHGLRLLLALGLLPSATTACGTDAIGIEACRNIEQARCRKASSCPSLGIAATGSGVEECVQSMRDRCLHGLAVVDPGPTAIAACVDAINNDSTCLVVRSPETAPACSFLLSSPATATADAAAEVSDDRASPPDADDGGG